MQCLKYSSDTWDSHVESSTQGFWVTPTGSNSSCSQTDSHCIGPGLVKGQSLRKLWSDTEVSFSPNTPFLLPLSSPMLCTYLSHHMRCGTGPIRELFWPCGQTRSMDSSFTMILNHTRRLTTVCRTSLYEWSARPRDLHLTTHKTHKRQTSMPPTEFEPTTSAGKQPQTYALDRVATGTGNHKHINVINCPLALIYFYYIYSDYMPRLWQSSADKSHEICKLHWCGIILLWDSTFTTYV